MTTVMQFTTTTETKADAEKLAEMLLERRLIACGQISGPITSVYRWQEQVHREPEYLLTVKTSSHLAEELLAELNKAHPYELAEILGVEISTPSPQYRRWVVDQVKGGAE